MPWDLYSASRRGSMRTFGSAAAGMASSVGGSAPGFPLDPSSALARRRSRLTTASPLQGRGPLLPLSQRISIICTPDRNQLAMSEAVGKDDEILGSGLPPLVAESEEFQLHGPPAAQDQWAAAALDSESRNFLDFLDAQILANVPVADDESNDEGEKPTPTATFEALFPAEKHTRVVAAQAFLHVLSLASTNLVTVRQDEAFGDIEIAIPVEA